MELSIEKYYLYIVTNKDKTKLEVDVAGALSVRLDQLASDLRNEKISDNGDCIHLLHWEEYTDMTEALTRKKELNRWPGRKKKALVNTVNPKWEFLNEVYINGKINT
jgi:putative endonuclease